MTIKVTNNEIFPLFPTMVFSSLVDDKKFLKQIEKDVIELSKDEKEGDRAGNIGWFSHHELYLKPQFKELSDFLLAEASTVMDFLSVVRDEIYLTSMWANIGYRQEYCHQNHVHPNSFFSGVLHVSTPPTASGTVFSDPRPGARVFEPNYYRVSEANGGVFMPKCEEGSLFMFPSYLPHGVHATTQSYGKGKNRITISFNIMMRGTITTRTSPLILK